MSRVISPVLPVLAASPANRTLGWHSHRLQLAAVTLSLLSFLLCCSALHCAALRWAEFCTVLHCTELFYTLLHGTVLYCTALRYIALHYIALHCAALCYIALYCSVTKCYWHCTGFILYRFNAPFDDRWRFRDRWRKKTWPSCELVILQAYSVSYLGTTSADLAKFPSGHDVVPQICLMTHSPSVVLCQPHCQRWLYTWIITVRGGCAAELSQSKLSIIAVMWRIILFSVLANLVMHSNKQNIKK